VRIRVRDSLLAARWHKLVWNVPFNGLSVALGGVTSDETLRDPVNEARVWALVREVQAIARADKAQKNKGGEAAAAALAMVALKQRFA
jgi:2-dehydropantoate 2-reductase